jgi:hypothetical protein
MNAILDQTAKLEERSSKALQNSSRDFAATTSNTSGNADQRPAGKMFSWPNWAFDRPGAIPSPLNE